MNNVIKFLSALIFFLACNSNQGPLVDYTKLEMRQIDGVKTAFLDGQKFTGQSNYTLPSGVLQFKYTYKDGLQHGPYETYYSNGNKQKEGTYNHSKQHGEYKEYYQSGPLKYHYIWDNDKKNGDWKSYYENGEKWTLRQFEQDKLDGKIYVWDETGRLGKEQTYKNGKQLQKINHFEKFEDK